MARHWHTLTVRFASDDPITPGEAARNPFPPQLPIASALREIFHLDDVVLDEVQVIPDDVPIIHLT